MTKPNWPKKEDLQGFLEDPDSVERQLIFNFRFNPKYGPLPFMIEQSPNLSQLSEHIVLLLLSMGIRALAQHNGLERAIEQVNDIAYGRIDGKQVLKMFDD